MCSKSPAGDTAQGLCDMAGNVYEWVEDCDHASYDDAPADGSARVVCERFSRIRRGGSWRSSAGFLRAAYRWGGHPADRLDRVGFRVARSSP